MSCRWDARELGVGRRHWNSGEQTAPTAKVFVSDLLHSVPTTAIMTEDVHR